MKTFTVVCLLSVNKERKVDEYVISVIRDILTMTFLLLMMILARISGMAHVRKRNIYLYIYVSVCIYRRKKQEEKTKMTTVDERLFSLSFLFFALVFIRRKSLADELIICLFSCKVTISLLMENRTKKKNVTSPEQGLEPWTLWLKATRSTD